MTLTSRARIHELTGLVRDEARELTGSRDELDPLLDAIGDARVVLLGEATHGTHEFYRARGQLTKRLVEEKGFEAVAVEGDWPDCLRVHRFVTGRGDDADAVDALGDFRRFPQWMWRNADVLDFVGWLRHRDERAKRPVGFFGMDLYSLHASAEAVLAYLERTDRGAAARARARYACLDVVGEDGHSYGRATRLGLAPGCADEVVRQLVDLQRSREAYLSRDGRVAEDEYFFAEQNARTVRDAETYYRRMFEGRVDSWNQRDAHMDETLGHLERHLAGRGGTGKLVVWAHNSHVGDARATWMAEVGELNVGQLARERWGRAAFLVGFTTYAGTVTAADDWDGPAERRRVRPALPGSWEEVFHAAEVPRFLLVLSGNRRLAGPLSASRLERAIGVVYRPRTERLSHYFDCRIAEQFDAVLHFDETRAVEPLERTAGWVRGEAPETFPSGL